MENYLIQVKENKTVTTSLLVAEKFNKEHKNVMQKIESLILQIEDGSKLSRHNFFQKSEYVNSQNKTQPLYYMNRDGFTLLAMGFTGSEALKWKLKYIEAFNEMEKRLSSPNLVDNRLEIAKLIIQAPKSKINSIRELYPEYFSPIVEKGSLEYLSDVNTSYRKWIEDYGITAEWITDFPTIDIFNNYMSYCVENRLVNMGKKIFYHTLETDFNFTRRQKADGFRYFMTA
jgi:Rha family phage regulatory protein